MTLGRVRPTCRGRSLPAEPALESQKCPAARRRPASDSAGRPGPTPLTGPRFSQENWLPARMWRKSSASPARWPLRSPRRCPGQHCCPAELVASQSRRRPLSKEPDTYPTETVPPRSTESQRSLGAARHRHCPMALLSCPPAPQGQRVPSPGPSPLCSVSPPCTPGLLESLPRCPASSWGRLCCWARGTHPAGRSHLPPSPCSFCRALTATQAVLLSWIPDCLLVTVRLPGLWPAAPQGVQLREQWPAGRALGGPLL